MRRFAVGGLAAGLLLCETALAETRTQVGPDTVITNTKPAERAPKPAPVQKPGYSLHETAIQNPVVGQPSTGENTRISPDLYDDSVTGNAPGMQYRKESGRQAPNTNNAGIRGNIGVPPCQPPGTPDANDGRDVSGQPVNPPSNLPKRR